MKVTLLPNYGSSIGEEPIVFDAIKEALAYFGEQIDELARHSGVYCTAASNGEECNIGAWLWHGDVVDQGTTPDYPDEILSVYWSERNNEWLIKREKA